MPENRVNNVQVYYKGERDGRYQTEGESSRYFMQSGAGPSTKRRLTLFSASGVMEQPFYEIIIPDYPAVIYYTMDGSSPTTGSSVYDPLVGVYIFETTTLKFFGIPLNQNILNSVIYTNHYILTVIAERPYLITENNAAILANGQYIWTNHSFA